MKTSKLLLEKFFKACIEGNTESVQKCIEDGVDVTISPWQCHNNILNNHALILACEKGHINVVKLLLTSGANIKARNNEPIISASYFNHLELVKYLAEQGADPTDRDNIALLCACMHGLSY